MSDEIKREFLEEAAELLQDSDQMLTSLRDAGSDQESIDRLFRNLHTVKGSAGVVGFMDFSSFLHRVEDLIDSYRQEGEVPSSSISILVACNDFACDWIEQLAEDFDYSPDVTPFEEQLLSLYDQSDKPVEPKPLPAQGFSSFDEEDEKTQATILIVDDEPTILKILETYLGDLPFKVIKANSGDEGLRAYRENHIDVIVSDLRMPEMGGIEFIQRVREEDPHVEVIFLSAQADRESMEQFIKLRTFGFVDKAEGRVEITNMVINAAKSKKVADAIKILTKLNFEIYMDFNLLQSGRQVNGRIRNNLEKVARLTSLIGDPDLIMDTDLEKIA